MMTFLDRYREEAYALLRIVAGLMFMFHGTQKLFGFYSDMGSPAFGSEMWFGGVIEFIGGLLVAVGLFTRIAAFIASGEMAVAYCQMHWKFQMSEQFYPALNHGELALVYSFLFLYIACRGAGLWSVDRARL